MEIYRTVEEMCAWSSKLRTQAKRVAFVPTMGALHEGHLSLMREGKRRADCLVLSIYVNPTQFDPSEDFTRYPRDIEGDLARARAVEVDAVFLPSDEIMYPVGYQTYVNVEVVTQTLCGASRPGHFRGVATIVAKLFNIVLPDIAIFGEKDFQQLAVIKKMVRDLNIPVEIVGCPIVREPDGLAMSSRNARLSSAERKAALSLSRSLDDAGRMIGNGVTNIGEILTNVRAAIESTGLMRIDYARFVDPKTLEDIVELKGPALLALAAFVGKTRLIDNRVFDNKTRNPRPETRDSENL